MGKSAKVDQGAVDAQASATANKQQQFNTQNVQTQAAYNRPDQTNAFGNSVNWVQTGTDANGAPTFSQNQSLGASGQQYASGLSNLGQKYFNTAGQGIGDSNAAFDRAYGYASANLEPRFQRSTDAMENKLRNQGLDPTSEAFKSRMNDLALQQNEARNNLTTNIQGQMFNQALEGRQQTLNELQPGVQFGNLAMGTGQASFSPISVGSVDYGQMQNAAYNQQNEQVKAQNAERQAMIGGLASLGGAIIGGPMGAMAGKAMFGGGGTTQPGTFANGGWSTTTNPTGFFGSMFG